MKELEQMLLKEIRKAMNIASEKVLADMHEETEGFYTEGKPKLYDRTGALGDTPRTTGIHSAGNIISFKAYLDTSWNYTTGDRPSMTQVLNLTNYGKPWTTKRGYTAKATLGKKGFWERAENKMGKTLELTMKKFFN